MIFGRGGSVIHLDDAGEKYGDGDGSEDKNHLLRQLGGKNLREDTFKYDGVPSAGGADFRIVVTFLIIF